MSKQRLEQKLGFTLSPQQIQFLGLLQTPIVLLEKKIEDELEENPALEEEEEDSEVHKVAKPSNTVLENFQLEDRSESLQDHLKSQLIGLDLNKDERYLVEYLIESLDESGFLNRDLISIGDDILINDNKKVGQSELEDALITLK